jgi:hypothetical protein
MQKATVSYKEKKQAAARKQARGETKQGRKGGIPQQREEGEDEG